MLGVRIGSAVALRELHVRAAHSSAGAKQPSPGAEALGKLSKRRKPVGAHRFGICFEELSLPTAGLQRRYPCSHLGSVESLEP
jgi:hypothetical protein